MPVNDPTANFQPAPLPPMAPDGGPIPDPAPATPLRVLPISRCQLGPCRHLHEITHQIEAQEPLDGSDGGIRTGTGRSCYAQPGVDGPLEQPVFACNKWAPVDSRTERELESARATFARQNPDVMRVFEASWTTRTTFEDEE